jgi:hypothetical protein
VTDSKSMTPGACPRSGTVSLSDGLLVAQGAISGVSKDSRNTFHKYAYTSAEGMISACRDALQRGGVVARRTGWEIVADGLYVQSRLTVCHGWSGESSESTVVWPIVVEKGRPVDKAVASALTTSLSYWLRDLLCLPREDESGHMDGRNDDRAETRHGLPPRNAANRPAARSESTRALNERLADAPNAAATTPVQASESEPPRKGAAATDGPTAEPSPVSVEGTARPPAMLHKLANRTAGNRTFMVAEWISDGKPWETVVPPDVAEWLPQLVGETVVPVVVDRGARMPMLSDVRTVAQPKGADDELPF